MSRAYKFSDLAKAYETLHAVMLEKTTDEERRNYSDDFFLPFQIRTLEKNLEAIWEFLTKEKLTAAEQKELFAREPIIEEVDDYGANGPVGLGIGVIGGHAIGDG